jgi:hypothetical protein
MATIYRALALIAVFALALPALADNGDSPQYAYKVHKGDNIIRLARVFSNADAYEQIVRENNIQNPNLIREGQVINIPVDRPINILRQYLLAIQGQDGARAYALLSQKTRRQYSPDDFDMALGIREVFDLASLMVVSDSRLNYQRLVSIAAHTQADEEQWVFHLVYERGAWRVVLEDFSINVQNGDE